MSEFMLGAAWVSAILLTIASLLPLCFTGKWIVRIFDFPRGQLLALLLLPASFTVVHIAMQGFHYQHAFLVALILAAALYQLVHIAPYTPLWKKELADAFDANSADRYSNDTGRGLRVLVANIKFDNTQHEATLQVLRQHPADVLLLVEIDTPWYEALAALRADYPHRIEEVRDDGWGLLLWSRLPLHDGSVRHLVSENRPSIAVRLELPDGSSVRFIGVHPTPPGLEDEIDGERHDSRMRDAELVLVAREVTEDPDEAWVVAGDFNDVAWSHTSRLFKRLSGLRDPRVGRTMLNSFHAQHLFMRFPIDQMFFSEGFQVVDLQRVRIPGSDHFAVLSHVQLVGTPPVEPEVTAEDGAEARQMVQEGEEDARERDVETRGP